MFCKKKYAKRGNFTIVVRLLKVKAYKKTCFPMCICMCILFAHKENEPKNAPRLSTKGTPNLKF